MRCSSARRRLLQALKPGDTLLVWRLDRLGRSIRHLIDLVEELHQRGIGFKSICDGAIDPTTASGELIFNVFASLAQFERRLIQERTKARLTAARARGRMGGRPPVPVDDPRVQTAKKMHADKTMRIADITGYRFVPLARKFDGFLETLNFDDKRKRELILKEFKKTQG